MSKKEKEEKKKVENLNKQAIYDPLHYIRCRNTQVDIVKDAKSIKRFRLGLQKANLPYDKLKAIEYHYKCLIEENTNKISSRGATVSITVAFATVAISGLITCLFSENSALLPRCLYFIMLGIYILLAVLTGIDIIVSGRKLEKCCSEIHQERLFLQVVQETLASITATH